MLEVCACDGAGDRVQELLQTYGAELIERFCDSLKFSIHRSKMTLSEAFIMMNRLTLNQQHRDTSSPSDLAEKEMIEDKIVRFYSISHSTMQDVFMAIVLQKSRERINKLVGPDKILTSIRFFLRQSLRRKLHPDFQEFQLKLNFPSVLNDRLVSAHYTLFANPAIALDVARVVCGAVPGK